MRANLPRPRARDDDSWQLFSRSRNVIRPHGFEVAAIWCRTQRVEQGANFRGLHGNVRNEQYASLLAQRDKIQVEHARDASGPDSGVGEALHDCASGIELPRQLPTVARYSLRIHVGAAQMLVEQSARGGSR